jgi:hypothetical protein
MIDGHAEAERLENMVDGAVRANLFDDRPLGLNALFRFQLGSNIFDGEEAIPMHVYPCEHQPPCNSRLQPHLTDEPFGEQVMNLPAKPGSAWWVNAATRKASKHWSASGSRRN